MALPLEFYENFEAGTKGNFDSETDDGNRLDFPHARDLKPSGLNAYRGAYCMRVDIGKNNNPAYLSETISWASGQTRYGRFRLFVGKDVQFGNNLDYVRILQFYSTGELREGRLVIGRVDPVGIVLAVEMHGETWGDNNAYFALPIGEWVTIEWLRKVDSSIGFMSALLPDVCQITSDRRADATNIEMRFGGFDNSGDLKGTLLFDEFAIDEGRLYDDSGSAHNGALSGRNIVLLKSGFAFLGKGEIEHVNLIDGGSGDCRVKIYDTDDVNALPIGGLRENLATLTASSTAQSLHRGFSVSRGAYVELSGTNPQAIVRIGKVAGER